jgi:hypothetical protein
LGGCRFGRGSARLTSLGSSCSFGLFSSKFGGLALLLQSTGFFLLFAFLFLLLHAEEFRVVVGIGPERFGWLQGLSQDSKLC